MPELIEASGVSILKSISTATITEIVQLVTENYYGNHGKRILASAKAFLNRDGYAMLPISCWARISSDVVCDVVGGDAFFVPGDLDRFNLARQILDHKLQALVARTQLGDTKSDIAQISLGVAPRTAQHLADAPSLFAMLYAHSEVKPLLLLLDEGIHYMHLNFEELRYIRAAVDTFGTPLVSDEIVTNALWNSMKLRQTVLNARLDNPSLHLSHLMEDAKIIDVVTNEMQHAETNKGEDEIEEEGVELTTNAPEDNHRDMHSSVINKAEESRRHWIPASDGNGTSGFTVEHSAAWHSPFTVVSSTSPVDSLSRDLSDPATSADQCEPRSVSYSHIPPFRFAVELSNPKHINEKKKIHSSDVWFAGSLWKIYCQKIYGSKGPRLGFYLYRAKVPVQCASCSMFDTIEGRTGPLERDMHSRDWRTEYARRERRDAGTLSTHDFSGTSTTLPSLKSGHCCSLADATFTRDSRTAPGSTTCWSQEGGRVTFLCSDNNPACEMRGSPSRPPVLCTITP